MTGHAEPNRIALPDAAATLGVSVRTLRRYIASGILPAYRVGPRLVRVDPADLDQISQRIPTNTRDQS